MLDELSSHEKAKLT